MTETAHGAQVVRVLEDHTYELDEKELEGVLLQEEIKDLPVVVVSVAGAYRRGKSFLLNFFLRYLTSPQSAREDGSWLGDDSVPLAGFSWRSGIKRNTTGILLWSEPVLMALPSGEKVAVLLMDTQGTFDSESTVRDCSTIFALSTLLSSVQIYNLSNNIQEDDLQHLQLFTEYGRMVRNEQGSKAFQVLEFLVRDWAYPDDYTYGSAGGELFLREKLKITPRLAREMKELRTHITSCFEKVSCFLMPHPGFKVLKKTFDGKISDIDPLFRQHLKDLVSSIFTPEKLMPKSIHGELVRARDLFTYFKTYMTLFNSDKIPTTTTIMEATVRAGMLSAVNEARAVYESGMDGECGLKQPSVPSYDLQDLHDKYLAKARAAFTTKKKMGSTAEGNSYLETLTKELKDQFPTYQRINMAKTQDAINRSKEAYDQTISSISKGGPLCVHPTDLSNVHKEAYEAARSIFDASRKHISNKEDKERLSFLKSFEKRYSLLRLANEQNNNTNAIQTRMAYFESMQSKCDVEPPLSEAALRREHQAALQEALDDFESKRNRPNQYTEDVFKYNLTQDINKSFINLKAFNKSKNKVAMQAGITAYNEYMSSAWDARAVCLHPADFESEHQNGRCRALVAFRPDRACRDGFDYDDSDEQTLHDIINQHYSELKKVNDSANESAVQEAFNLYCSVMDDLCRPNLWWLLIIPIIVYITKKGQYHEQAKGSAIEVFFKKRRPSRYTTDSYYDNLIEMMEQAFANY